MTGHTARMGTDRQDSSSDKDGATGRGRREQAVEERERLSAERERVADDRERVADAREKAGDEREHRLAAREDQTDQRAHASDQTARASNQTDPSRWQSSYEHIDRITSLLTASRARLERSQAALRRRSAREVWEQASIELEIADSALLEAGDPQPPEAVLEARVARLRELAASTTSALAAAHDAAAEAHERHARPREAADHRRHAEQARRAAGGLRAAAEQNDT